MNKKHRKHHLDPKIKISAAKDYLHGFKTSSELAHELNVDPDTILNWAKKYKLHGPDSLYKLDKSKTNDTLKLQKEIEQLKSTLRAKDVEIDILKKFQAFLKENE
ncbi:helix-turn-helix domain-containing protein [Metabacillus herbersteinensis]|uniref:Helix-turn-helix domain-containing protein n=1 Tax=Metabacillus herbersteinensis TaxID=283816 RepID=A0ABV6GFF4_9BACI